MKCSYYLSNALLLLSWLWVPGEYRTVVVVTASIHPVEASKTAIPKEKNQNKLHRQDPLLLRAARGDIVERFPVWMMRQAGRHMAAYRNLLHRYPTFRQRSETPTISREISLQPLQRYGVDGVILFSDILTPLPAMGINFDISEGGQIEIEPVETLDMLQARLYPVTKKEFGEKCNFVGSVLYELRQNLSQTSPDTTLLGFVGLPFTLSTYLIEGRTGISDNFPNVHRIIRDDPDFLKSMLLLLSDNIIEYASYQIESGAQVLQVFDSWAGYIEDGWYVEFCQPYQQRVIRGIQQRYPDVPIIIYMAPGPFSKGGRRLEALSQSGADIISVDHTIDIALAKALLPNNVGIQGNLNPDVLRDGPLTEIQRQTLAIMDVLKGRRRCIINLGHGILPDTPEPHADCFVRTVQSFNPLL